MGDSMKVLRWALAVALAMATTTLAAAPAAADHIRAMVAYQVNGSATSGEITLRVEYNYSGNCCGGAFSWDTGETTPRYAWVEDGLDNAQYMGDATGAGTFDDGSPFTWARTQPDQDIPLVRIDITWSYPPVPATYDVTWSDCFPQSDQNALVVVGSAFNPQRVRAPEPGNPSLPAAFTQAAIPQCPLVQPTPPTPPIPLCYELVSPVTLPSVQLGTYDAILVGSEAQAATVTALGAPTLDVDAWLRADVRGIAVYGQSDPASWGWLPTATGTLGVSTVFANDVSVTPSGMAHMSHVNQLPTAGPVNGTLAGWTMSTLNTFPSWPAYFAQPLGDALATRANGAAVALAGHYDGGPGCQVITGQPIDDRAYAGNRPAAQQMFRSTLAYALTCVDAARV
jgi:hypothetical protein